jgi:hypothetical protein
VAGERLSTAELAAEVLLVVIAVLPISKLQIAMKIGKRREFFIRDLQG